MCERHPTAANSRWPRSVGWILAAGPCFNGPVLTRRSFQAGLLFAPAPAPSRRELLQFGGLGLALASAEGIAPKAFASERKATPRGNARNVLYFEISGAISHIESFDFKENAGTPKDLDRKSVV